MARVTATEAARGFSGVLARVAAGEEVEVTRSAAPVARVRAEIWADLSQRSEAIGGHHLWIAATAPRHALACPR